jgi:hypothetical protein
MSRYTFTRPPRALRRAHPDNVAIVPASLLPFRELYQQLANNLPTGATLIVLPEAAGKSGQTLVSVAKQLRSKGHQVNTVPTEAVHSPR